MAFHVTGLVARARVTQRFCNPTQHWVEGVYAFPLPENAAVDTLTMTAGGRVIEGQIKEREEARQLSRRPRPRGQTASLLEQQRPISSPARSPTSARARSPRCGSSISRELLYDSGRFSAAFSPWWPRGAVYGREALTLALSRGGERGETPSDAFLLLAPGSRRAGEVRAPSPIRRAGADKINPVRLTADLQPGFSPRAA